MCGILFSSKLNGVDRDIFSRALSKMHLRGPDNTSINYCGNTVLGHVRLSILDTTDDANQPMWCINKRYALIYNGEIYNYPNLRNELVSKGVKLKTHCDTEVLLQLLISENPESVIRRLEGMFAFVLWDTVNQVGFAARDHFGQKPLFYFSDGSHLCISSSMNSLRFLIGQNQPDVSSYRTYLCTRGILSPGTTFDRNVYELPAGHFMHFESNEVRSPKRYFYPPDLVDSDIQIRNLEMTESKLIDKLEYHLRYAVDSHLLSDVPIGVLLSGGVDSSLVYWYSANSNKEITSFIKLTPDIEQIPLDVVPKILKSKPSTAIFSVQSHLNYIEDLWRFIDWWGTPPPWGGGPPMNALCQEAKDRGVSVLLGGDCADEYFAGYNNYTHQFDRFNGDINDLGGQVGLDLGSPFYKREDCEPYINYQHSYRKESFEATPEWLPVKERYSQACLLHDTGVFLQKCNLPNSDAYSMMSSVELRNPLLDINLVRYVVNLQCKWRFEKNNEDYHLKRILRDLAIARIGAFINKPKEGTRNYSMHVSKSEYWNISSFKLNELITIPDELDKKRLFQLICLEMFHRQHICGESESLDGMMTKLGKKNLLKTKLSN